jgi:hypothetical protein
MKDLFQLLKKHNLTPNGYYLLYCLDGTEKIELAIADKTELHRLQLMNYVDSQGNITSEAKMILIQVALLYTKRSKDTDKELDPDEEFKANVKEYINLFPSGVTSGKALRGSVSTILPRLRWFFNSYPEYTWENVYMATKKYIESLDNMTYCKTAAYFVKKDDKTKNTISLLADWCAAIIDDEDNQKTSPALGFNRLA